jgi:hypothetical protein
MKKLKIDMTKLDEDVVILNTEDPVSKFKLQFCKVQGVSELMVKGIF